MDWSGAYDDYIKKLESQRDVTNFMPNFDYNPSFTPTFNPTYSPSNTFNPTYAPSTNVDVSPTINQNPSIEVSPTITNTLEQTQQQTMGGSKTGQSQSGGLDLDFGDGGGLFDADIGFADDGGALDTDFFTNAGAAGGAASRSSDPYRNLVGLSTVNPVINQSPSIVVSPTISNKLSQQQAQWMGGGGRRPTVSVSTSVSVSVSTSTSQDETDTDTDTDTDTGTDSIIGGNDNDTIDGGNGTDTLVSGNGTDTLVSGNGADTIVAGNGTDSIIGGGNTTDTIDGGLTNIDSIIGGNTTDSIIGGGNGVDSIIGGNGEETLPGGVSDATKLANDEIVKQAYENLFNRPADQEGLDYWSDQLDAGKSPTDLLRDLVSGAQGDDAKTAANTKTVNDLYRELLGRDADEGGLDYYRAELAAGAKPEDIARNIISGAKAGSEASEISQAEYDKYFRPTPQPDTSTRPTPENVDSLFPNVSPGDLAVYKDATASLNDLARDFMANQDGGYDMASYDPEGFREAFVAHVAQQDPELFSKISGLDLAAVDLGEGILGTSAMPLISAVNAAFNSDSFADAAGNIDRAFATAGIADVAATALAMAGLPVVGQVAAAAIMLDSVLSKALGYDSPIQDGVDWMAQQTEKAAKWISDTFGDLWGGIEDFVGGIGDFFSGIGDWFAEGGAVRFQEGGLVDFPSESAYNYTDYYGATGQPQLSLDQVQPEMAFAGGGLIPLLGGGKIAKGPGGGLDDLIPTSIDGRRAAALSDGEFVIPADVVSMMGDGSSDAGAKRFYDLVKQIRQHKTGTEKQAGPLPVGKILERTIS
jgi:Ca2+-binding RTX toxin-like protein